MPSGMLPAMMRRILVPFIGLITVGAACPPRGESAFSVKGKVLNAPETSSCQLALYAPPNTLRATRAIGARFDTAFTIPARTAEHYFVITCSGVAGAYRTGQMVIAPHSQVDLGEVTLNP